MFFKNRYQYQLLVATTTLHWILVEEQVLVVAVVVVVGNIDVVIVQVVAIRNVFFCHKNK